MIKLRTGLSTSINGGCNNADAFAPYKIPLACVLAGEKADSCNTHLNVLAQVDATDKGIMRKLPVQNVDILLTKCKRQQEEGWLANANKLDDCNDGIIAVGDFPNNPLLLPS